MIHDSMVLAVVPARGGSRGLPGKNLRHLAGKSLLGWTIAASADSKYIDRVIVSTDDEAIAAEARRYGAEVPFMRPARLASDEASTIDVVVHAIGELPGYSTVVVLQPTSPLRTAEDIDRCIERCRARGSCVSVSPAGKLPHWMFHIHDDRMEPLVVGGLPLRRQDATAPVVLNGAVYAAKIEWLLRHRTLIGKDTVPYVMPKERSVDIDDEPDLLWAEALLRRAST